VIMASEFKQRCLAILDRVEEDHMTFIVTKHGRPVARLTPLETEASPSTDRSVTVVTSSDEDLFSTGETWAAEA